MKLSVQTSVTYGLICYVKLSNNLENNIAIYVREIRDQGIGAFSAKSDEMAIKLTDNKFGSDNVIDVRDGTKQELDYIEGMGGFVPERLK